MNIQARLSSNFQEILTLFFPAGTNSRHGGQLGSLYIPVCYTNRRSIKKVICMVVNHLVGMDLNIDICKATLCLTLISR